MALLVGQDRRHLFVTPGIEHSCEEGMEEGDTGDAVLLV
jgi:hypothetical protein